MSSIKFVLPFLLLGYQPFAWSDTAPSVDDHFYLAAADATGSPEVSVISTSNGKISYKYEEGPNLGKTIDNIDPQNLVATDGCVTNSEDFCVNRQFYIAGQSDLDMEGSLVTIRGIRASGAVWVEFNSGKLNGQLVRKDLSTDYLAFTDGCSSKFQNVCVGYKYFLPTRQDSTVDVVGIMQNGQLVVRYLDGHLQQQIGTKWDGTGFSMIRK